jgi:hypothetical protein
MGPRSFQVYFEFLDEFLLAALFGKKKGKERKVILQSA